MQRQNLSVVLWTVAAVALAVPGGLHPVLELATALCDHVGISTNSWAYARDSAELIAMRSLPFRVMSFIATVMAWPPRGTRYRWLLCLPPLIALVGSLSFWLRGMGLYYGLRRG